MPSWTHTITLDATDITAQTTLDSVLVEEAERESWLMDVLWRPPGGQQTGLALKPLILTVNAVTLFSGLVIRAQWIEKRAAYFLRGSTRLQEHFRALGSEAAVAAVFTAAGGFDSADWLGEPPDDLWAYAEQLMETLPADVHIDRAGARQIVDWEAAATPDHTLTAAEVDNDGDVEWVEADADTKTNRVIMDVGYSVQRQKIRAHSISWRALAEGQTQDFCSWIQGTTTGGYWSPPVLTQVQDPLSPKSWSVPDGVDSEQVPLDEPDLCFNGMPPLEWYFERDSNPLMYAAATGYQAFSSEIQETYTMTVDAGAAQTLYGSTVTQRRSAALTLPQNDNWPPQHASGTSLSSPSTDTVGDDYVDDDDEPRRVAMLDCAYAWGKTRLLEGQRRDGRRVRTILRPDITVAQTVRINAFGLDTTGKVRRLRHTLAPYRTEVEIAISRGGGVDDAYSAPARPNTSDPITYWEAENGGAYTYPVPSASTTVPTYVGSRSDSPNFDTYAADEPGYFTNSANYLGWDGNPAQIYDMVFRVRWPEREEEATAGMAFSSAVSFNVRTPADPLVIS